MSMFDEVIVEETGDRLQTKTFKCVGTTYKIKNSKLFHEVIEEVNENEDGEIVSLETRWDVKEYTGVLRMTTQTYGIDAVLEGGVIQEAESFNLVKGFSNETNTGP